MRCSLRGAAWWGAAAAVAATAALCGLACQADAGLGRGGVGLPAGTAPLPAPFGAEGRAAFTRDGYLLVRGLLHGGMLADAQAAARDAAAQRHWLLDAVFSAYAKVTFAAWRRFPGLARAAFASAAPSAAAALSAPGVPLRIMKDAVIAFEPGRDGCGWHVDDKGFWPALDGDGDGVNVWVALSRYRAADGGGLGVANGSHAASWWQECHDAIAPPGYTGLVPKTCDLATLSPACWERMEERSVVPDMEPGDALLLPRRTFHRTMPFRAAGAAPLLRYTVRYVPETLRLHDAGFEAAVRAGSASHGAALRDAGAYYPQAWPRALDAELAAAAGGLGSDFTAAYFLRVVFGL